MKEALLSFAQVALLDISYIKKIAHGY